jgi:hypothetical protein
MKQAKVIQLHSHSQTIGTFWHFLIHTIRKRLALSFQFFNRRRPHPVPQMRERTLITGHLFRTDGIVDELIMESGYVLRTLDLDSGLTISLVDPNGKDIDFECCETSCKSDQTVKYTFDNGSHLEIGSKLRILQMPGGERVLLDHNGIVSVIHKDDVAQMRRSSISRQKQDMYA